MIKSNKDNKNLTARPPVVVVLGHVDHGKSSLLEAIKDFEITSKESGGITQHVAAYEVEHEGKKITFIDTPGHEAFSAIRARGAKLADIAVLVIAAEEGVKQQTKEALSHIKNSKIPFIIALNKIDKQEAQPEKVKRELLKEDISVESMGGSVPSIEISAKTKKGIPELLEMILLVSEMEELKTDVSANPKGVIVESFLDNSRGPTTTIIVTEGVLKQGDIVGAPSVSGRVRILENFQGKPLKEALTSQPAIIVGFEKAPRVGEEFMVFPDTESAKAAANKPEIWQQPGVTEEGKKALNIILKADVLGSLEAILEVLKQIPQEQTIIKILKAEAGDINESDVKLAQTTRAKIIGFRVKVNAIAKSLALREKITTITFNIIYELSQAIKQLLQKTLEPETIRTNTGKIKILDVFKTEKTRQIIGGRVTEGFVKRGSQVEVERGGEIIGKGKIVDLQRQKKEADEVAKGSECGLLFEGPAKIEKTDILIAYKEERKRGELQNL
jgi:translation initiation factor IF-2